MLVYLPKWVLEYHIAVYENYLEEYTSIKLNNIQNWWLYKNYIMEK